MGLGQAILEKEPSKIAVTDAPVETARAFHGAKISRGEHMERAAEGYWALRMIHQAPELGSHKASGHLVSPSFAVKGEGTKNGPRKPAYMFLHILIRAMKDLTKILLRSKTGLV